MAYDSNNIFARILRGEIPNKTVFESEHVLSFHDAFPKAPVHILIIPKGAYLDAGDFAANATDAEKLAFFAAIDTVVTQENLAANGYRLIANTGDHGGQEVPHFHMHILAGEKIGAMRG